LTGFVIFTEAKKGGVMKYTFCPGLGKSPRRQKAVKEAMAPVSSFPGRPVVEALKKEGV
jgi:hypothetical protein